MFPETAKCRRVLCTVALFSLPGTRALTTIQPAINFRPSPSPRFDEFSEKLLGEWSSWHDGETAVTGSVQEVMRSCGGAVQGVREVPGLGPTKENKDGIYLNRSNDGFVFFDQDASYSFGPVALTVEASNGHDTWISSLGMGKSRLCIVSAYVNGLKEEKEATASSDRCYQLFRKESWNNDKDCCNIHLIDDPSAAIVWSKILQCKTCSSNQPWMLQRVKWESLSFNTNVMDIIKMDQVGSGPLTAWKLVQSSSDMTIFYPQELLMGQASTATGLGAICSQTGYVKSIIRQYSIKDNTLQSVALLEGRLNLDGDVKGLRL
ncbi:hypothetical protein IV203_038052 [Nitzschia inconspicua]|uniref:Uncharacterized protein n=1 Tax=Nitzschia inconspicua TaxID=303405 RepID=A0A9K3LLW3_9STRA|nr:hypothetical protein IV203_038052 [Nitzschia inconspicua]